MNLAPSLKFRASVEFKIYSFPRRKMDTVFGGKMYNYPSLPMDIFPCVTVK